MNRLKTFAKFEETKAKEMSKPASWALANKYKDNLMTATKLKVKVLKEVN